MLENQLEQLGLHKNEIKVYLALFDFGKCKAGQIIEQTGLHRNLVYTSLDELVSKKLISKVDHGGVAMFSASSPDFLQEMVEEKAGIASQVVAELKKKNEEQPRDVVIYEGDEGIKRSRNRVLSYNKGDTLYVIGSKASSTPEMEKYWRKFHAKRVDQGIALKILYERGVNPEDLSWRNKLPLSEAKYLPLDIDMPIWFSVIRDYLEIGIPGDEALTFGLHSSAAAGAIQKFFEYFWNQKVATENGVEALRNAIYGMLNELNPGDEYFVLGASVGVGDERVQKLNDEFHADRIKKGVVVNMLAFKEGFKKIMDRFSYCGDPTGKVSRAKAFISAPPIPMQINIFKNKTFFIIYGDEPTVISFDQPEISQVFKNYFHSLWNQTTNTLFGENGVKELCEKVLEEKEDLYLIGATGTIMENHKDYYLNDFTKRRVGAGLKINMLANQSRRGKPFTQLPNCAVKYLPVNFESPMVIWVFGDYVANVLWHNPETIFLIHDKAVAEYYRKYYNALEKISEF